MDKINREQLVRRHNPVVRGCDKFSSLTVGNGNYAFTVDATGLQTFPELYEKGGVALGHLSNWGWHTSPNPMGYEVEKFQKTYYSTFNGRAIGFPYMPREETSEAYNWLRMNPHRLHLGAVQFLLTLPSGEPVLPENLQEIEQTLDLWTGVISSSFSLSGETATVLTCCHPNEDILAIRVKSSLLLSGQLKLALRFPYGSASFGGSGAVWDRPESHWTEIVESSSYSVRLRRTLDQDNYFAMAGWSNGTLECDSTDPHLLILTSDIDEVEFVIRYSKVELSAALPDFEDVLSRSKNHWPVFWNSGGAVELAGSQDIRAHELERRIVLSQYLTAVQSSGSLPPQETGLTMNSWAGKFHLEMHWWHSVHFALWNRTELLANSLGWYREILSKAQELAHSQGYEGARWPKCVTEEGINAPCFIEPFLIWQQPHPIYFAELLYTVRNDRDTLERYQDIVFQSADFMASFAEWDDVRKRYVLGPPLAPAQEIHDHAVTMNPTFELAYWAFGLSTANRWREKLGLSRVEKWDHVLEHLSPLPVTDGLYVAAETAPDTFSGLAGIDDHPTMLAPLGILPGLMTDPETMRRTLHEVIRVWHWEDTWGWDYPMMAMTAARLGEGKLAVDLLLIAQTKNTYLPNGHNFQTSRLPIYLPGNGGLLTAVAMMAGGWLGGPDTAAPGFPQDGTWTVRSEGINKML
ncbi:glycoside hydrolase family 65 [Paenibacillus sp. WQ 127069]|uniref:Glycoside hydrolase family 65 n=1 Tax=Paenibacillus baimaensis TaxID=2982185 RepID=A0ABT2UU22_9BACL|nr:glycoside hydrolase family 65 [Paenibacillus sp. WQ 127069]MCU6798166.1 glycoside hydrolase family 65 [Paenibacillus sp. WQ 127069]